MDVFQRPFSGSGTQTESAPIKDPRLQPTPDYGTLGPASDIATVGPDAPSEAKPPAASARPISQVIAAAVGICFALLAHNLGNPHSAWSHFANRFHSNDAASPSSPGDSRQLDRMNSQKQAEALLAQAVGRADGALEQIASRVDGWRGKLKWNSQIASLTTAALNSNDMRVRESGVEVELAAYGLAKNPASLDYLLRIAEGSDHARKIWALWALGLMANRGVETDRITQVLLAHLNDADQDSRRWAVEALALLGTTQTIEPLLKTMHDDPSPLVRERAACSLAMSGMLTHEQRLSAVPQLLNYTDDPSLDAQTHGWAFLALADITGQRLPNDSAAWRHWYENSSAP